MDKIRKYFNSNQAKFGINILYSTPSCYLKSLHEAKEMKWNVKTDDFFPYASDPHAYWTGYFTSRSTLKGMIRESNSLLQACKQINALYGGKLADERLEMARRAVSVNQHHDAVTGRKNVNLLTKCGYSHGKHHPYNQVLEWPLSFLGG